MKHHTKYTILIALGACLLLPFSNPGLADEAADTPGDAGWHCNLCPVSGGWLGEWNIGLIFVSDPSLKFADYRGLDEDDWYLGAGGEISYRNDNGNYLDFYGRDLGLDSRALEMRGGKQGKFEIRANYSEIPRFLGYNTQTPFSGVGTDTLQLPESWSYENGELAALQQSLAPVTLESKRETFDAGLTIKLGGSWKYNVDFERQTREGTRAFSGGLFAVGAAIFPAPVDFTTEQFNMDLEFTGNRAQLRLEFTGSDFNNGNHSVTWDNPFAIGFGGEVSRSALEPDNEYYQFSLAGAVRFSPGFRISGKASVGEAEQDDAFLPYSINPVHDGLALPRSSLGGRIDTSMFNLSTRLYLRLADRLDLTAQYKVNERDNRTPVSIYTPVLFEVFQMGPRSNRPYSYERSQGKLELRFRPTRNLRVNAGLKRYTLERTLQEVSKTDEDSYWGELQFSPVEMMNVRLKIDSFDRGATPYEQLESNGRAEHPLMRKFNMAERDRERATVEIDLSPTSRLGINLSYYTTDDNYDTSVIGLTGSEEYSTSLDLNFAVNGQTDLYAFITEDEIESEMSGAASINFIPWNAYTKDHIQTWGMGFSGQVNERVSYGFDYVASDSEGDILTDSSVGEAAFPVLQTDLRNARIYLRYKVSDSWSWGIDAYQEKYATSDWLVDGIGPDDINAVLTMGETSPDYEVSVVRLLASFRF
jgi:MtrB/PioB family decaheme-associated outer membrane protein